MQENPVCVATESEIRGRSPGTTPNALEQLIEERAPTVSVIIPCYEQAHFLGEAIESVLAQTYPTEIIVVDDGSPDNAAAVSAQYPQVQYIRQRNKGLAEARNSGFRAATGKYVIFLDADDRLTPNAVESHLRCFADHPWSQLVVGDIDHIAEDGSYQDSPRWPVLTANFYQELLKVNHVANTIAAMMRREVVASIGGFETSCSPAEDYRLLLRAVRSFPSAHHRTVVAQHRIYPGTLSHKGGRMLRALHHIMALEWACVKGDQTLERARRIGWRYWRDYYGRVAIRELFRNASQGELIQAGKTLTALVRYVGFRVLILPWKYRRQIARKIIRHFG
jgi:glycosyltransferase involved in cell wall biosynthesis